MSFNAHSESIHHGDCFCIYYPPLGLVLDTTLVTLNMIPKALATELSLVKSKDASNMLENTHSNIVNTLAKWMHDYN